ncbi:MAG: ABC transporter substrate-binding protein, partial [Erysipelotrichales bacterium]|nr:ABC transporter substrate-binding protein [Erysipelotrichales bacterium]
VVSNEAPGKNVTGTLDMPVIYDQISVIKEVLPETKTLGILYTSSEPNSEIQAEEAKVAAQSLGMEVVIQTASSSNDIKQVVESVVGSVDAVYIPSDNAFANAMATVHSTAVENQLPVFAAVEAMIAEGAIATTAIDYYELGKQTAAQAVRVLEGESASNIAVETQEECALVVNKTFAESVGVVIPEEIVKKAAVVY